MECAKLVITAVELTGRDDAGFKTRIELNDNVDFPDGSKKNVVGFLHDADHVFVEFAGGYLRSYPIAQVRYVDYVKTT